MSALNARCVHEGEKGPPTQKAKSKLACDYPLPHLQVAEKSCKEGALPIVEQARQSDSAYQYGYPKSDGGGRGVLNVIMRELQLQRGSAFRQAPSTPAGTTAREVC